jgi:antitoxin VapB
MSSPDQDRAQARRASALGRVRAVATAAGAAGVVLTRPGPVAWASGGINVPIDRTAGVDTIWLAVGPDQLTVITTEVEEPRLRAELLPTGAGLLAVPWWDGDALAAAAVDVLGADPSRLGGDGASPFGIDLDHELTAARLPLSPAEAADLRDLGRDAARAVEDALVAWRPGETDYEIAGRIAAGIERTGGDPPVLLVGGDDRLERFRHPVANGSRPRRIVMAVLVARRGGLHVALTRHAATGSDPDLAARLDACRRIHRAVLAAGTPGATYGSVLEALDAAYAAEGAAGAWRQHYQGGPIGYGQREFEISPAQTTSPWWPHPVDAGVAVAWNPSLPGGAKDEDTYLVGPGGVPELVTTTGTWPAAGPEPSRPAVLVPDS